VLSATLIKIFLVEYFIVMVIALWEKNYPLALYWLGAVIINGGVLWGMIK